MPQFAEGVNKATSELVNIKDALAKIAEEEREIAGLLREAQSKVPEAARATVTTTVEHERVKADIGEYADPAKGIVEIRAGQSQISVDIRALEKAMVDTLHDLHNELSRLPQRIKAAHQ